MPLVFIHGVSVRKGEQYDDNLKFRNANFFNFILKELIDNPKIENIFNPYWGGNRFAWNHASLPKRKNESLGTEDDLFPIFLNLIPQNQVPEENEISEEKKVILAVAQRSMKDAIGLLWAVSSQNVDEQKAAELAELAVRVLNYIEHNNQPSWLSQVRDDSEFLYKLEESLTSWEQEQSESKFDYNESEASNISEWESLGGFSAFRQLKMGRQKIERAFQKTKNIAGSQINKGFDHIREKLHHNISLFLADIFAYLAQRGTSEQPGEIITEVLKDLKNANSIKLANNEKLIVIAHSMGGNIIYDILTTFTPEIEVDMLVTVGSQVGLFEEMKLFKVSQNDFPSNPQTDRLSKPSNIKYWLNVFDEDDILGFTIERIFNDVKDEPYFTGAWLNSHTAYFSYVPFYKWLSQKISEAIA
jgi:hypothetical protein